MPQIDLSQYVDLQYFQYSIRRTLTALQRDTGGFTKIQNDSDFLVQKIVGLSTGIYNFNLLDTGTGRQFFDRELNNVDIVGTAQRPNVLLQPKLLYANSTVNSVLVDTSNAGNTVELVLEGIKCYKTLPASFTPRGVIQLEKYAEVDYFAYSVPLTLAANGSSIGIINIQGDSDFLITKITGNRTGAYRLQIADLSCGWTFSDQQVADADLVGTAQQPNVLLHPQLALANSSLQVQASDVSGNTNTIEIVIEGVKLFLGR